MDLPFAVEDGGPGSAEDASAAKVLVVDDEPLVLDVLKRLLAKESGLSVNLTGSAEQALRILEFERYELLVTDKNLPGMGGIDLIAASRKRWPMIEAVMITGYASAESVIAALAAGASDYLLKPFDDIRVVRAKILAALERRATRVRYRQDAQSTARIAAELLRRGQDAPDSAWHALEARFQEYERAIREGGIGQVRVVGGEAAVAALKEAGFPAIAAAWGDALLAEADVVVVETGGGAWLPLVERIKASSADAVLLSGPNAELADLLEALNARLELVAPLEQGPGPLIDRVRSLLLRRSVTRAQEKLAQALSEFQARLRGPEK